MNPYVFPDYPRDALRRPGYYERIPGYYDRPICDPADTIRGPGLYNYPMPYGFTTLVPYSFGLKNTCVWQVQKKKKANVLGFLSLF